MQNDPVDIINALIAENAEKSPVDCVAMAGYIAQELGGMKGVADRIVKTMRTCKNETNRLGAAFKMIDLMFKAHELQKAQKTATDLSREQLTAVMGLLNRELERRGNRDEQPEGDAFGSPPN